MPGIESACGIFVPLDFEMLAVLFVPTIHTSFHIRYFLQAVFCPCLI